MSNTKSKNQTLRNLLLDLYEVGESINAFQYAYDMMIALKNDEITPREYELLSGSFYLHCKRNQIETSNEICSLF
jgi:hypothetical protein